MSLAYCAELVKEVDEDRFLSAMTASPDQRAHLFPLYAFNVEVSRAAWASNEPMLCHMRLQYWRDLVEAIYAGEPLPNVPVAAPLADLIKKGIPKPNLLQMIDARSWDVEHEAFDNAAHFTRYLEQTSGNLMNLAALVTGANEQYFRAVRAQGYAMGLAKFLIATPELIAHGRKPLLDDRPQAISALAADALGQLSDVCCQKTDGGQVALRAGWDTRRVLKLVIKQPKRVLEGRLRCSEFRRRGHLLLQSMLGRW